MSIFPTYSDKATIVEKYFSDASKCVQLRKNEVLLEQGEVNRKLYYVQAGKLAGYLPDEYASEPIFEAIKGSFLGVYSYFSDDHSSYSQVQALQDSTVYYLDRDPATITDEGSRELLGFLFNLVVVELKARQRFAAHMASDRQDAMNKLIQTEKLVTLGQLSAGLAHELNNTIGSFNSNLGQLETYLTEIIQSIYDTEQVAKFQKGKTDGLTLSSREEREIRKGWPSTIQADHATIKNMIRAGITSAEAKDLPSARTAADLWNIGQILHDLKIASTQAAHVVSSIKTMGIAKQNWSANVKVNDTIREAIVLLKSITKYADIQLDLDEALPEIEACHGELVQVWVNLIKNAVENLRHHQIPSPALHITSKQTAHHIEVSVADNGTGIDETLMSKVFEPSFTTKVEGLSLGLGLGLTIVQRIVSEHHGRIKIKSKPGETIFITRLKKRS